MDVPILIVVGLVGLVLGFFVATFFALKKENAFNAELIRLRNQKEELEGQVGNLRVENAKFDQIEQNYQALRKDFEVEQIESVTLRERVAASEADVSALREVAKQRDELKQLQSENLDEIEGLRSVISSFESARAVMEEKLKGAEQEFESRKKDILDAKEQLTANFRAMANQALAANNDQFLKIAEENLKKINSEAKGELELQKKSIELIVDPMKEALKTVESQLTEIEKGRIDSQAELRANIQGLVESQKGLQNETRFLSQTLRNSSKRGRWGELQLVNIVKMAGMTEYVDFDTQKFESTEEGTKITDMEIRLPNGQRIVIDSKAPIDSYLKAIEEEDDMMRKVHLAAHARDVRSHVKNLSSKEYQRGKNSPEFVVMFLFAEPIFSSAVEVDPELIEYGAGNQVIIATPSTLIALLKAVAYGWKQSLLAENAKKVADAGQLVYERLANVAGYIQSVGKNLNQSVNAYNDAVSSIEGRLLPAGRRLKELGIQSEKEIAELQTLNSAAKTFTSDEMTQVLSLPEGNPSLILLDEDSVFSEPEKPVTESLF